MLVHEVIYQGDYHKVAFHDKVAVTYGQLQQKVQQYRDYFYQQGISPGDNVGLLSRNSVEFVYSYFAITSLGAVAVPINFQMVPREIAYIIVNADIKTIITRTKLEISEELHKQSVESPRQLVISEFENELDKMTLMPAPKYMMNEGDVCAIIYTSGTTGNPKGAMLSHENIISNAQGYSEVYPFTDEDHVLCILPMYHCFAWTCVVVRSLFDKATITIMDLTSVRETLNVIRNNGITVIYAVPTICTLFATQGTPEDFASVRILISGGAALPQEVLQQFLAKTGFLIAEGYGLSEAAPTVSVNPAAKIKTGSVGAPLPRVLVKIEKVDGTLAQTGEIGELLVAGPGVMQGYYNLPEETKLALRNGWLHTGDIAYLDEDGYIYIVDRLKDMIITSGENVYPREIEEVLYTFPNVREAAVIGAIDKLRGCVVRAYYCSQDGEKLNKKKLREHCQKNLAPYKVPKEYVQLDTLPKNGTGKIVKAMLKDK